MRRYYMTFSLTMWSNLQVYLLFAVLWICQGLLVAEECECAVSAQTEYGVVCGTKRQAADGSSYASFRGVPYAKQPLGELRFKELQPADPWDGFLNATTEGPVCPQKDVLYGRLAKHQGMSEECIHANIHVPINALPSAEKTKNPGLPILIMTPGGSFAYGSGDSDLYGPEYMVSKGVVFITFNYRLNVFGYLSLNTSSIPGNNGLRDVVTLLKWVKRNAAYFGGNPEDITLAGQSSGACNAHHVSLSTAGQGLFKRMILMSGVATIPFYSVSPAFSQTVAQLFVSALGINTTDPEEIHKELISLDIDTIMAAHNKVQDQLGLNVFVPVLESKFAGVTTMIDDEPVSLLKAGRGKNIEAIIGFTDREGEFFRRRFEEVDIVNTINADNTNMLGPRLLYKLTTDEAKKLAKEVKKRYVSGSNVTLDEYLSFAADDYFVRPAIKLANWRASLGYAPTYLYQFSYNSNRSVIKQAMNLSYVGATHVEDMTYVCKENAMLGKSDVKGNDAKMRDWMSAVVANFVKHGQPIHRQKSHWPAVNDKSIKYQSIKTPEKHSYVDATKKQKEMVAFLDRYDQN